MRVWKTEMHIKGGEDYPESSSTVYKSFNLREVKKVIDGIRDPEIESGMPRRKTSPVFRYVLEYLTQMYLKEYAPKKAILEKIIIKDTKDYGL